MTVTRLVARPLLSSMFVLGGVNALQHTDALAKRAKPLIDRYLPRVREALPQVPIPSDPKTLVRMNAGVQIASGLAFATGRAPRASASLLAASLVPTTMAGHRFWAEADPAQRSAQRLQFAKNMSVMGGLLLASVDTEGRPGVAWRAKHAVTDVRREARHLSRSARKDARLTAKSLAR